MNTRRTERFDDIARLFRYPGEDYAADARALAERLEAEKSKAADALREFVRYTDHRSLHELEETYTRTFDLNPSCSPEIGWHLFGEEYVRGLFMVQMRNEMRQRGLEETVELPDHVVHVLAVLGAMDEGPGCEMARACVCPAVGKMLRSFEGDNSSAKLAAKKEREFLPHGIQQPNVGRVFQTVQDGPEGKNGQDGLEDPSRGEKESDDTSSHAQDQPFRPLVSALAELVLEEFDLPRSTLEAKEEEQSSPAGGVDPLHSMPCGGCGVADIAPLGKGRTT